MPMQPTQESSTKSPAALRRLLASRPLDHVVVLGANGTMGYGSGALFTQAVERVTFLARTREKAREGLEAAIRQVRSPTVASRVTTGSYEKDLDQSLRDADLVFEALTEDFAVKTQMFDRVEKARRADSIVATVTSGLSIDELAEGRSDGFRRSFLGLHLFNPPNVIVGTELIPGRDTDPAIADFVEAFAKLKLGREIVRTADTPAFAGNRVGFKVLNEAAQLAAELGPAAVDRILGPYTGRALPPLQTIDLVGWDIHRAIVDNVHARTADEARETLELPGYMARLIDQGVLGDKSGGGFFKRENGGRLVLDPATGSYRPEAEVAVPELGYVSEVSRLYAEGRYPEGLQCFLEAPGDEAALARRVIAGYVSYAFHRAGEVTETINGIDRIMGAGFNWAPPSVLVDTAGPKVAVETIEAAALPVPAELRELAQKPEPARLFRHPHMNPGRFFFAA